MRALVARFRWPLLGAAAASLAVCTVAVAGSGVGGTFNLGQTNTVDAPSVLTGNSGNAAQLRVENTGGGSALSLVVNAGVAPFKVSSSSKVGGLNSDLLDGLDSSGFWKLGGNAGTNPANQFVGTTDNKPLELKVNGQRALRLEPTGDTPNVIGGDATNLAAAGVLGATIFGGSGNRVSDALGTVGGGANNSAGDDAGTATDASVATVGGGVANHATGAASTIGGGQENVAEGGHATIGGGDTNFAGGALAVVGGGLQNGASGVLATVGGGSGNRASGRNSVVPGGQFDVAAGDVSFAAGRNAKANHQGAFVWADSAVTDFASTANDQFDVRASGGARFVKGGDTFPNTSAALLAENHDSSGGIGVEGVANTDSASIGVLGISTDGLAGRFNGDVHVTGTLTRAYTSGTSNQATPLAYGVINANGTKAAGTPNVSSSFDSTNSRYVITIAGDSYSSVNHITTVTPLLGAGPVVARTTASSGRLVVLLNDLGGSLVQQGFSFATYKP